MESDYRVRLEVFEGPLHLLYHLVEKDEIDIWDIPIAKITEQYLAYLEAMRRLDVEIAGEFLVMAARLLQIKARMLLPVESKEDEEDEETLKLDLAAQLLEYKVFRELAGVLKEKAEARWGLVARPSVYAPEKSGVVYENPIGNITVDDLAKAFRRALDSYKPPKEIPVPTVKVSVAEKIASLRSYFLSRKRARFSSLIRGARSRAEVVATFLALLELIRLRIVLARQDKNFSTILIEACDGGETPLSEAGGVSYAR